MLYRLHLLALRLAPLRPWCLVLAVPGLALILHALTDDGANDLLLRLALVFTLWVLQLFAFLSLFQSIPPPVLPKDRWWERLRARIRLAACHLLVLLVALTSLGLLSISLKLIALG